MPSPSTNEPSSSVHNYSLDLLRIFACFLVILLHTSVFHFYNSPLDSAEWASFNFYNSFSRSCVPLFFMISGSLFLSRKQAVDLPRLFSKNILKLFILYILWSFFFAVDTVLQEVPAAYPDIPPLVIAFFEPKYHLWFLPAMIGVYLVLPFLQAIVQYENGRFIRYFCIAFFLFIVLNSTLSLLFTVDQNPFSLAATWPGKFSLPITYTVGYFILGHALNNIPLQRIKRRYLIAFFIFLVILSALLNRAYSISTDEAYELLYGYSLLPAFGEACALFLLFRKISLPPLSNQAQAIISTISKCTLGIYLLHLYILEHLYLNFNLSTESFNSWFSTPLISLLIFSICLLVTLLLKKLPFIGNYIV